MLDLAIIGGGPAGLSAGLYATRGGLKNVVMYEKAVFGGQITTSSELENYPGVATPMDGLSFMEPWIEQSKRFGLKHEVAAVKRVSKDSDGFFTVWFEYGDPVRAKTIIAATGASPRKAGFKGESEFFGKGIGTCATCDGFFYKNKEVGVLGGGDTALEEALYLANICSKVYLIHRREGFRAAPVTVEKVKNNPKIELVLNATIDEVVGDKSGVTAVKLNFKDGSKRTLDVPGLFVFVGLDVRNEILKDENGEFICNINSTTGQAIVDLRMNTNVAGLFAAGDLRIDSPKQVVCSASDGAIAALEALHYIENLK